MATSPSSRANTRYWCYTCNAERPIYEAPDPTCQRCNEQFVEEIDSEDDPRQFLASGQDALPEGDSQRGSPQDVFQLFASFTNPAGQEDPHGQEHDHPHEGSPLAGGNAVNTVLQNILGNMLNHLDAQRPGGQTPGSEASPTTGTGTSPADGNNATDDQQQQQRRRQPVVFYGGLLDGSTQLRPINLGGDEWQQRSQEDEHEQGATSAEDTGRSPRMNNIHNLLQLISALTGAPFDAGFVGNPNDYVFSQNALDNIITQLMEQTSGRNAPPPAPEDVINKLPHRELTEKERESQTDCAVCKEEFEIHETVTELPCAHLFHDDCIKPWLKVNGTCPVCRRSLNSESSGDNPRHEEQDQESTSRQENQPSSASQDQSSSQESSQPSSQPQSQRPTTAESMPFFTWFSSPVQPNSGNSDNENGPSASPSAWPTSIPGAFTWGPGGQSSPSIRRPSSHTPRPNSTQSPSSNASQANNNDANDNNNNNTHDENHDTMDLDLD
ncbi:hypothetical protein BCR43DRAFT_523899 [Syncephalastrum racemosum]|uniref:RING-type E3 ubiquitin transferase n=1 Tax=Syncephalastrum racemosum TaxID=13706 RepID=A0A1X2HFP4_SYNRA|nr:hypothetical protein BCR43DRAFT_523899 [Syncephalastrum racemosum]